MNPGSIVRCRNRDWVVLPSHNNDIYILRPLAGATDEIVVINKKLSEIIGYDFPEERIRPSTFPPPEVDDVSDTASAYLLWQAVRLTLREGATPFRSLGRISIRPRVYQFVPLLMALRLDPVRLFIADDVGVGKTIEALLIAREMFDRGEIRRLCILCPPYLCDQWQKELNEKFNMDSVVIRSGTISRLERYTPAGRSIYEHYPIQVVSIDFAKTERNRHQFLQFCPEMVIVDEVHGAAEAHTRTQQERHALPKELASNKSRHIILLTATPHSGIEEAFRSLLGLINPEFKEWIISDLNEEQRISLARHFVQRTRKDIEHDWEEEYCFPFRETSDETYTLSDSYRKLFDRTYEFCSEIVRSGEKLEEQKRRIRYWGALALLRCIMSSPAAALTTLSLKEERIATEDVEEYFRSSIFESSEDRTDDEPPATSIEKVNITLSDIDRRRLQELRRLACQLNTTHEDTKLKRSIDRNSANHGIYLLESQRLGEGEFWFLEFREFGVDI